MTLFVRFTKIYGMLTSMLNIFYSIFRKKIRIIINKLPEYHIFSDDIYIAGNFNSWNFSDDNWKLKKDKKFRYYIDIETQGILEFKFSKGKWEKEETDSNGVIVPNHVLKPKFIKHFVYVIANWADGPIKIRRRTASLNVEILNEKFWIPQLKRYRRIWIYKPTDYNTSAKNYPVIYMHDGQNLFDESTAFAGEWKVDKTLNQLNSSSDNGVLVVGIDNGAVNRINEYSPWKNKKYGGGDGDKYIDFIVSTLKPYIDSNYRTFDDRTHTGIIGSSMGGLISYYAGLKYQEVFEKIGVFSPSLWFSESSFEYVGLQKKKFPMKFYFLAGTEESADLVSHCEKAIKNLKEAGFTDNEIILKIVEGARHSETFWSQEFEGAYKWLFDK